MNRTALHRTVTVFDIVIYGIVMFAANFVSCWIAVLSFNTLGKLVGLDGPVSDLSIAVPIIVLDMTAAFMVILLADFLFFRTKMEQWTRNSFSENALHLNFTVLVLPAEMFRFLLCMLSGKPGNLFGYRFFDGVFSFIPSFLHDQFYLTPHSRWESIHENGLAAMDHFTFFLYYLGYFLVTCIILYFLYRYLWIKQERQTIQEKQNRLSMDSANTIRQISERNFCYEARVTGEDCLKFGTVSIGVHFAAYFLSSLLFSVLLGMLPKVVQYPLCGILYIVFPVWRMGKYLDSAVPPLYSMRDDQTCWYKKAITLMLPGEIVRFMLGILPSPLLRYGMITSPLTGLLYELLYIFPTGKYERIMGNGNPEILDIVVFLLLYIAYFAVYELVVLRMIHRRFTRHILELDGQRKEQESALHG